MCDMQFCSYKHTGSDISTQLSSQSWAHQVVHILVVLYRYGMILGLQHELAQAYGLGQLVLLSQYHSISILLYEHIYFKTLKGNLPVIILKLTSTSSWFAHYLLKIYFMSNIHLIFISDGDYNHMFQDKMKLKPNSSQLQSIRI